MIDKDFLQKRLHELEQQKGETMSTLQAIHGAMQECEYLLNQLKTQKKESMS